MATLNIDIEKAAKKIYNETNETGCDLLSRRMAEQLPKYHPDLFPIIESWMKGEEPKFEYQGINLDYIMKKQGCCYISAVGTMSVILKGDITVDSYKKKKFGVR